MTNIYIAKPVTSGHFSIIGTMINIASKLQVTRTAVHKAFVLNGRCKHHTIELYGFTEPKSLMDNKSKAFKLREAINLLRRAIVIIDNQNEIICNQLNDYSSVGIVEDIDRYFNLIGAKASD